MNELKLTYEVTPEKAQAIVESIQPEIDAEKYDRSTTTLTQKDGVINLEIEAKDLTALRAAINTHVRFLAMCTKIIK